MEQISDRAAALEAPPPDPADRVEPRRFVFDALDDAIGAVQTADRMIAMIMAARARQLQVVVELSELNGMFAKPMPWKRTLEQRALRLEVAMRLRISERAAEAQLAEADQLVSKLPATLAGLAAGEFSYRHAQVMVEQSIGLSDEDCEALEAKALPYAVKLTPPRFKQKVRTLRELLHPEVLAERNQAAREQRRVELWPAEDGMAWLSLHLSAEDALGAMNRITAHAKLLCGKEGESRTVAQIGADFARDLMLDGVPTTGKCGIRPKVFVTVPVLTLLGKSEAPGNLNGYGPIDADTARRIAAHAPSFIRILTHPETGAVLSIGRDRYRVPKDLRDAIIALDETCRAFGCGALAGHCDIDHVLDWAFAGETNLDNLIALCRSHHTLKTAGKIKAKTKPGRQVTWTGPKGGTATTEPAITLRL